MMCVLGRCAHPLFSSLLLSSLGCIFFLLPFPFFCVLPFALEAMCSPPRSGPVAVLAFISCVPPIRHFDGFQQRPKCSSVWDAGMQKGESTSMNKQTKMHAWTMRMRRGQSPTARSGGAFIQKSTARRPCSACGSSAVSLRPRLRVRARRASRAPLRRVQV